jgi:hypothetical protein
VPQASDIGDSRPSSFEEWSVSRYDKAILSLDFMVKSMSFDLKVAPQVLFFPTTSKPKSMEIHSVHRKRERLPSNGFVERPPEHRAHAHPVLECALPIKH